MRVSHQRSPWRPRQHNWQHHRRPGLPPRNPNPPRPHRVLLYHQLHRRRPHLLAEWLPHPGEPPRRHHIPERRTAGRLELHRPHRSRARFGQSESITILLTYTSRPFIVQKRIDWGNFYSFARSWATSTPPPTSPPRPTLPSTATRRISPAQRLRRQLRRRRP